MSKQAEIRDLLLGELAGKPLETEAITDIETETDKGESLEANDAVQQGEETEKAEPDAEKAEVLEAGSDDEIVTIASLAADLEIEPGQLYGMRIPVDGHDPLSIGELKDIAQQKMQSTEEVETVKNDLAERQAELERKEAQLAAQAENVAPQELVKAEAELARAYSEFAAIDWPALEAQNPGEAALRRQKLMEQYQIATYNRDQITQRMETTRQEIHSQREQAAQQQQARAVQQLTSLIPEWRDEAVYKREREHMVNALVAQGVAEQTVRTINDPTLVKFLRDTWKMRDKIDEAKAKIEPPKVLKAAATRQAGRGKAQAEKRFLDKAAKSKDQRVKDEAARLLIFGR